MAFKMKGSSYKMGGVKTKSTMAYMKSPMKDSKSNYNSDGQFKKLEERESNKAHNKSHSDGLPEDHVPTSKARPTSPAKQTDKQKANLPPEIVAAIAKKSPVKQTDFFDKVKSAGRAVYDNLGKVNSVGNSLSDKISSSYGENKKEYRAEAKKSKMASKTKKSPATMYGKKK